MKFHFWRILSACLLIAALTGPSSAQSAAGSKGPILLTVSGAVDKPNRGPFDPFGDAFAKHQGIKFDKATTFDLAALEALGTRSFTVKYPDWDKAHSFEGPLMKDVLVAAGAQGKLFRVLGIDGYRQEIPPADLATYPVILAIKMDGAYLGAGGRGPINLIYPYDDFPALKEGTDAKWVWGTYHIQVE